MIRPEIGCVVIGTGHPEDSLPLLAEALETLDDNRYYTPILEDTNAYLDDLYASVVDDEEDQEPYDLLDSLLEALNELSPNYVYFGEKEEGYEEYGYWVNQDYLAEEIAAGEVLGLKSVDMAPIDYTGFILVHDTSIDCTLYTLYSRSNIEDIWEEEWSTQIREFQFSTEDNLLEVAPNLGKDSLC